MSHWTHVIGTLRVSPMGRTQPEKRYILETVLAHLPLVTGSEEDMKIHINVGGGASSSSSCDEFQMCTDKGISMWDGTRKGRSGWFDTEEDYLLTVVGNLRDREFDETYKEFQKWLTRLAKRVIVDEICVKIYAEYGKEIIISDANPYIDMWESPSWGDPEIEPNWCEYLMWKRWADTSLPLEHVYKYYNDEEADKEVERKYRCQEKKQ